MELYKLIDEILLKVSRIIREEKEKLFNNEELNKITYGQFNILYWISIIENPTITELAKKAKMTKSTMTVHVQNLERIGLVIKERSETDKRMYFIRLSEMGIKVEKAEINAFKRMATEIKKKLDMDQVEKFKEYLSNLL